MNSDPMKAYAEADLLTEYVRQVKAEVGRVANVELLGGTSWKD